MPQTKRSRKPRSVDAKQNKAIKQLKTQVKKLTKAVETKSLDDVLQETIGNYVLPSGDYRFDITGVPAFVTNVTNSNENRVDTRIGNSILVKRFEMNGMIRLPSDIDIDGNSTPSYDAIVRAIIVHTPGSATPGLPEILEHPTDVFSQYKRFPDNPYKVLYDKQFDLQATIPDGISGTTRNATAVEPHRRRIKVVLNSKQLGKSGIVVEYGQGNNGDDPVYGGLTMYFISTVSGVGFIQPTLECRTRLRYLDQ